MQTVEHVVRTRDTQHKLTVEKQDASVRKRGPAACLDDNASPILSGGVHSQKVDLGTIRAHWIQGTIPHERVDELKRYLTGVFQLGEPERVDYGQNRYDKTWVWELHGVRLWFDSTTARANRIHGGRACICIPGDACDALGALMLFQVLKTLVDDFWLLGTRADVAYDEPTRMILPHEIAAESQKGNYTGFRRSEHQSPLKLNGQREGDQIAFGRRGKAGSGKYLRIYDKLLESDGDNPCVRYEVEFAKRRARAVIFELSQAETFDKFVALMAGLVGGAIDFIERDNRAGGRNIDRASRLDWWSRIVERLGRVRVAAERPSMKIETSKEWVETSVATTLATLRKAIGQKEFKLWIEQLVEGAEVRITPKQSAAISEYWKADGASNPTLHPSSGTHPRNPGSVKGGSVSAGRQNACA